MRALYLKATVQKWLEYPDNLENSSQPFKDGIGVHHILYSDHVTS